MSKSSMFSLQNPKAKIGYKILACLLMAYGAASWAIDNGSPWLYIITIVFCYAAVQYFSALVKEVRSGKH
ncbi:MAG: hypothetical protein KIH63_001545 [Candidatus Saccharibacteria bacterium]|nr:hypothetical protein [Candidatus Saccharibacteria bacterium]